MKVYVVMTYSTMYDEQACIDKMFSTMELAEKYVSSQPQHPQYDFVIDEWEVE